MMNLYKVTFHDNTVHYVAALTMVKACNLADIFIQNRDKKELTYPNMKTCDLIDVFISVESR